MPLYDFVCSDCQHAFEVRRSISEGAANVACPACESRNVQRVFTPIAIFSSSGGQRASIGSSGCGSCAATSCSSCPSTRK